MNSLSFRALLIFFPLFSMLAPCIVRASTVDSPAISAFGSTAAQATHFHWQRSDYAPSHYLTAPGSLEGHWLASNRKSSLEVDFLTGSDDYSDQFIIRTGSSNIPFQSCYGQFLIYDCDVTGDGVDEIILEDGRGRGTFVYQRRLRIFKSHGNEWQPILMIWLSGYLPHPDRADLMWLRRYSFQTNEECGLDLVFDLYPPSDIPPQLSDFDTILPLALNRFILHYDTEAEAFRLKLCEASRLYPKDKVDVEPINNASFHMDWHKSDELEIIFANLNFLLDSASALY